MRSVSTEVRLQIARKTPHIQQLEVAMAFLPQEYRLSQSSSHSIQHLPTFDAGLCLQTLRPGPPGMPAQPGRLSQVLSEALSSE